MRKNIITIKQTAKCNSKAGTENDLKSKVHLPRYKVKGILWINNQMNIHNAPGRTHGNSEGTVVVRIRKTIMHVVCQ